MGEERRGTMREEEIEEKRNQEEEGKRGKDGGEKGE